MCFRKCLVTHTNEFLTLLGLKKRKNDFVVLKDNNNDKEMLHPTLSNVTIIQVFDPRFPSGVQQD